MMYHFFSIGTYSSQSTKVLDGYVVMYAKKSKFEPSGTLVLWGESIRFCKFIQILFQIGWISLNGTAMQLDIEVSLWP